MIERRSYRITGTVQGVGFRWWTRKVAVELDLRGTVRNVPDGSVEVRAAGAPRALGRLEARLRDGPTTARVEGVRREEPDEGALPAGFEIVR